MSKDNKKVYAVCLKNIHLDNYLGHGETRYGNGAPEQNVIGFISNKKKINDILDSYLLDLNEESKKEDSAKLSRFLYLDLTKLEKVEKNSYVADVDVYITDTIIKKIVAKYIYSISLVEVEIDKVYKQEERRFRAKI